MYFWVGIDVSLSWRRPDCQHPQTRERGPVGHLDLENRQDGDAKAEVDGQRF
jgi:hypothetical protein